MSSPVVRVARRRVVATGSRVLRAPLAAPRMRHRRQALTVLIVLVTLLVFYMVVWTTVPVGWSLVLPLIVISGVVHRPAEHAAVVFVVLASIAGGLVLVPDDRWITTGALVAGAVTASVTMWRAQARARVGVTGVTGEYVLEDLRSSLQRRSLLPDLPRGWQVEGMVSSAYGHPFSGDFIVSWLSDDATRFEAVLVDVSGKGVQSASRAVSLSGALEALLGAVPPEELLGLANDYVVRQGWAEGYATAVHVAVDLDTAEFRIFRAGHPPAARFRGGSDTWQVLEDSIGPALGLVPAARYGCDAGVLGPHDAVLLYSDGLVERQGSSLDDGIDRLLGQAEQLVVGGFTGGPESLCAQAAAGSTDDCSVVLLWRS